MKVAVTGATGFIGQHIVAALLSEGVNVVAVAREPERVFTADEQLSTVSLDINNTDRPFALMGKPDILLHLAWGGLPHYHSNNHLLKQLPMQIAFLDACARDGLRRVVVTGTCLEYGMQSGCLDESLPAIPIAAYGQAKDRLRMHLQAQGMNGGPLLTWLRLFYLYGPGQAPTSLYSQLRAAIETGAESFPMSPGDQERDFLRIETAAEKICKLTLAAPDAGIVNICSGVPKKVSALIKEWIEIGGGEIRLNPGAYAYPDYEPHSFWGSTEKLDTLLGELSRA